MRGALAIRERRGCARSRSAQSLLVFCSKDQQQLAPLAGHGAVLMHQPERVVERADLSDGGCATPGLHFVCILGKRHALHICAESAALASVLKLSWKPMIAADVSAVTGRRSALTANTVKK